LDEFPSLQVRLAIDGFPTLPELLRAREIELFVSELSEFEGDSDLTLTMFKERRAHVFCRNGHPLLSERKPTLKQLVQFPLVCTTMPHRIVDVLREAAGKKPERTRTSRMFPSVLCQHLSLHRAIIANSDAVGLATFSMIEAELRAGTY
jgi:DNA-binding transcriptional LysR family regulator